VDNNGPCRGTKREKSKSKNKNIWRRIRILLQPTSNWGPASRNLTPSRTLTHTPSSGIMISFIISNSKNCERGIIIFSRYLEGTAGAYDSVRDTIVLVNGQPMMVQPSIATTQKLPGPSILKNSSKTDLITSQQV